MNAVSRPCPERELLLHSLADGELDAANALAVEEHVRGCAGCAAAFDDIVRQKDFLSSNALRFEAPSSLRGRIMTAVAEEGGLSAPMGRAPGGEARRRRFGLAYGSAAFSGIALAASLLLFVNSWSSAPSIDGQLVASHVRSLLAAHLTDIASSDQHSVKPWFLGKLDFAPPVIDLSSKDFPLVGGRLDYIGGRVVPALIYARHKHIINLFVWPAGTMSAQAETLDGYHVIGWTQGGFAYAAVSDLNLDDLRQFQRDLQEASL